jgi:hypothetical protein
MDDKRHDERTQRAAANAPVQVGVMCRGDFPGELFPADFWRGRHDTTSSAGAGGVAGAETPDWKWTGKRRATCREKSTTRPKMQKAVSDRFTNCLVVLWRARRDSNSLPLGS